MRFWRGYRRLDIAAHKRKIVQKTFFRFSCFVKSRRIIHIQMEKQTQAMLRIRPLHRSGHRIVPPLSFSRRHNTMFCTGGSSMIKLQRMHAAVINRATRFVFSVSFMSLQDCYASGGNGGVDGIFNTCSRFIKINTNLTFCNG